MKTVYSIGFIMTLFISVNGISQVPDQNPNYKVSQDKYIAKADDLNSTQGETIQDTYEAFDWTEYKAEKKQDRKDKRYEIKKMRYQHRHNHYQPQNNGYYNGNGSYYNNGGYYNNGYNGNNYNTPNCNSTGTLYNSILLGAGLYYLFN